MESHEKGTIGDLARYRLEIAKKRFTGRHYSDEIAGRRTNYNGKRINQSD